MQKTEILGVGVHAQRFDDAISTLAQWAQDSQPRYVCTCPVYTLMKAQEISAAGEAIAGADMVCADGMPVVWLQRRRGHTDAERCYGPDIMRRLFELTTGTDVRHYLWGGLPGVPEALQQVIEREYPGVNIVGAYAPPLEPVGAPPNPEHIERINAARPDVVWVGLGSPKQDVWMAHYREHLNAPLLIGVGAAFDFISGTKRQAPDWMKRSGLEWAFRLIQEPRRLATRYLKYNSLFIWRLVTRGEF